MEDINYDELFGVESAENGQGDNAGSGSEAAPEGGDAGGEGGKAQASVKTQEDKECSDGDGESSASEEGQEEKKDELTPEERAKNAARRRKAEIDAAAEKARKEEREVNKKQWDEFFAGAKLKNPLDGNKPIASLEDFKAYQEKFQQDQLQKRLKAGKLTPEDLGKVVAETDVMKKAQQIVERAEAEEKKAKDAQTQAKIDKEIQDIGKLDPSVKSMEDLLKMERHAEFYDFVKRGYSFYDAFRLANFDKLTQNAQAAARQQALNRVSSMDHLTQTTTRGAGAVTVPSDEMELYREIMPDATDADIQKHYNSYIGKQKK